MRTSRLLMAGALLLLFTQQGGAQTSALRNPASLAAPSVAPQAAQAPQATQLRSSMFGSSSSGSTASGASSGVSFGPVGRLGTSTAPQNAQSTLLQGNERFLRRNRRAGMFVGADAQEARTFVGMQPSATTEQVAPTVGPVSRSPTATVATDAAAGRDRRAYPPRLAIGFDVPQPSSAAVSEAVTRQLATISGLHPANRIEVSVAGRVATLTGVVASARDRALIESLVLFEPGIAVVRNDLQVQLPTPRPPDAPPTPTPPPTPGDSHGPR